MAADERDGDEEKGGTGTRMSSTFTLIVSWPNIYSWQHIAHTVQRILFCLLLPECGSWYWYAYDTIFFDGCGCNPRVSAVTTNTYTHSKYTFRKKGESFALLVGFGEFVLSQGPQGYV